MSAMKDSMEWLVNGKNVPTIAMEEVSAYLSR